VRNQARTIDDQKRMIDDQIDSHARMIDDQMSNQARTINDQMEMIASLRQHVNDLVG